jgi:signal peptidase
MGYGGAKDPNREAKRDKPSSKKGLFGFGKRKDESEEDLKSKDDGQGKKVDKKGETEDDEEEIKYSILMWLAIALMFIGILFSIVMGLWMGNSSLGIIGVVLLVVSIPLFIFEYRKMEPRGKKSVKRSALLLLRDVAIAFLIVGIIMGSIVAYSQVWPPMVVIESESMQHSDTESSIGTIDTGDLVLVKKSPNKADVVTYVEGRARNYMTYSDYGDVIVFRKWGAPPPVTPIIHRAMIFLEWNGTSNASGFDAPSLEGLELNVDWGGVNSNGTAVTSPYNLTGFIWIDDVGYTSKNMTISLQTFIFAIRSSPEKFDVYLTAGDHNLGTHSSQPDPWYVKQEWIIGVARGELPWFGLIKLTLNPEPGACCDGWGDPSAPANSWSSLMISLILIVTIPFILDFAIGFIMKRRKKKKSEEEEKEEDDERPGKPGENAEGMDRGIGDDGYPGQKEGQGFQEGRKKRYKKRRSSGGKDKEV